MRSHQTCGTVFIATRLLATANVPQITALSLHAPTGISIYSTQKMSSVRNVRTRNILPTVAAQLSHYSLSNMQDAAASKGGNITNER